MPVGSLSADCHTQPVLRALEKLVLRALAPPQAPAPAAALGPAPASVAAVPRQDWLGRRWDGPASHRKRSYLASALLVRFRTHCLPARHRRRQLLPGTRIANHSCLRKPISSLRLASDAKNSFSKFRARRLQSPAGIIAE